MTAETPEQTATLLTTTGLSNENLDSGSQVRAVGNVLEAVDGRGKRRRWTRDEVDRVIVTPTRRRTEERVDENDIQESRPVSPTRWPKGFPWAMGRTQFCLGDSVVLHLPMTKWGPGTYSVTSPHWDPADHSMATGVAAIADQLGVPVEQRESCLPVPRDARRFPKGKRFGLNLSLLLLGVILPLAALVCVVVSASVSTIALISSIAVLGAVQLLGVLGQCAFEWMRWHRARAPSSAEVVLEPHPRAAAARGFLRCSRVLQQRDHLLFRGADLRERAIPLPGDSNGPTNVEVRDSAARDDREPYRIQFRDARGTVLVELGWDDWCGGRDGAEQLQILCNRWGVECDVGTVRADDMPAELEPWDSRQTGERPDASWYPGRKVVLMDLVVIVAAIVYGFLGEWFMIPIWSALGVALVTWLVPSLVRFFWSEKPVTVSEGR